MESFAFYLLDPAVPVLFPRVGAPYVVWWTFKRLYGACFVFILFGGGLGGGGRVGGYRGGMYYCSVVLWIWDYV
jgi:hypothetical protein